MELGQTPPHTHTPPAKAFTREGERERQTERERERETEGDMGGKVERVQ